MKKDKTTYELQAEICKILASPKRIEIIAALQEREKTVTEIIEALGIPKANVSQHLALMRLKGIVKSRREGNNIYYSIANPKVIKACGLMREVLSDLLAERGKMASLMNRS
ncbi:MAG TPA: metalloregulator ArsR/SmtB family transcription factor [Dissulfurispiraceae bacterium]|nr:metalloregulator ArsR/SmtB family transcription factor [Dissulfurispiraceae bacterium]